MRGFYKNINILRELKNIYKNTHTQKREETPLIKNTESLITTSMQHHTTPQRRLESFKDMNLTKSVCIHSYRLVWGGAQTAPVHSTSGWLMVLLGCFNRQKHKAYRLLVCLTTSALAFRLPFIARPMKEL